MANYTINYSCGHTVEKQLYGKITKRTDYVAWAEKHGDCDDCKLRERRAEKARLVNPLAHRLASIEAVSDAQLLFAEECRADAIQVLAAMARTDIPTFETNLAAHTRHPEALAINKVLARSEAHFWISNRHCIGERVLEELDGILESPHLNPPPS